MDWLNGDTVPEEQLRANEHALGREGGPHFSLPRPAGASFTFSVRKEPLTGSRQPDVEAFPQHATVGGVESHSLLTVLSSVSLGYFLFFFLS